MPEYIYKGTVTFRGVDFFINADDAEAAKVRANRSSHDGFETDVAEVVDYSIDPTLCVLNE